MNVTPSVVYVSKTGRMLVGQEGVRHLGAGPAEHAGGVQAVDGLQRPARPSRRRAGRCRPRNCRPRCSRRCGPTRSRQTQEDDRRRRSSPCPRRSAACSARPPAGAAKLAGFEQAPLLQEPIAAAIAYGAGPASRNQRWMVFDLGGGTLDIAVVSTRNDRLAVLEHQGDNRLGGKDIDRIIADAFLLEPLAQTFALPDRKAERGGVRPALPRPGPPGRAGQDRPDHGAAGDGGPVRPGRGPRRQADRADADHLPAAEVEAQIAPLIDRCLALAERAMEGARLAKSDLDRVLLVGGPTQMPVLRAALEAGIGAKLDHSLDPMTVVSHGAALYASTLANGRPAPAVRRPRQCRPSRRRGRAVPVELSLRAGQRHAQSPGGGRLARRQRRPRGQDRRRGRVLDQRVGGRSPRGGSCSTSCSTTASR